MKVALFVPCFVDQFEPDVAWATVEVLRRYGCEVVVPKDQTCCGQPLANSGYSIEAKPIARHFVATFTEYDYIVSPSASCVAMVRKHYAELFDTPAEWQPVATKTYELCEFLCDVLKVTSVATRFPHRVAVHRACHGVRELGLTTPSERSVPSSERTDKVESLLTKIDGLVVAPLERADECCGFGGSFAVKEDAVSCSMGCDKLDRCEAAGASIVTATDTSCLLHLNGLIHRQGRKLKAMHVAQILAGRNGDA